MSLIRRRGLRDRDREASLQCNACAIELNKKSGQRFNGAGPVRYVGGVGKPLERGGDWPALDC